MMNKYLFSVLSTILLSFNVMAQSYCHLDDDNAIDTACVSTSQSKLDQRAFFKNEIIQRALEITVDEYGAYEFIIKNESMNRSRALIAIINGRPNNVYIAPNQPQWDQKTIAIKIPVRMGLLTYRLLLIHKDDLEKFSKVENLNDLKALVAGAHQGSTTAAIFKEHEINMVEAKNFDGLFLSLNSKRFDYIPRTIYEIFDELDVRKEIIPNVVVEPTLALYIPTSTYIYVSPKEPRLAQRIEKGIKKMVENGDLLSIVNRYYKDDIKKANVKNRRIITIDNPFYHKEDKHHDEKYWYKF